MNKYIIFVLYFLILCAYLFSENIKNKDILIYNLPKELGSPQLTKDEINNLKGKSPEYIREKINTTYDLLQYMISVNYKNTSGDIQLKHKNITWHYNKSAEKAIIDNNGNCGATANMVKYLLKDDYEEVGFINFIAGSKEGGHIYNYIKAKGIYFVIDFLQYVMKNYQRYDYYKYIYQSKSLDNYYKHCIDSYGKNKTITIIVSYIAESHLPTANDKITHVLSIFPEGCNINILYDKPNDNIKIKFLPCPLD